MVMFILMLWFLELMEVKEIVGSSVCVELKEIEVVMNEKEWLFLELCSV